MIAIQGDDIDLTLFLTRNRVPYTSQSVNVKVIREENGFVEIASQALTEVNPGTYTYKWTNPPNAVLNFIAEYTVNSKFTTAEEIQIINLQMGEVRSAIEEMAGVIEDTERLAAVFEDTLELGIAVEETERLVAAIEDSLMLEAVFEETERTAGVYET